MKTNHINELVFDNVKTNKFYKNDSFEAIAVSLEKGKIFAKHTSPLDVCLVMLKGKIEFRINNEKLELSENDTFYFDKNVEHDVYAFENSKFLLIR